MTRAIVEPGGVLVVGVGLARSQLAALLSSLYPQHSSLTLLLDGAQQNDGWQADEIWVYGPLGLRGAMALIRRISWRRFDLVVQPEEARLGGLKYFVWPRPDWASG